MEPPYQPSDSDCCNSGCNPCILDVYETQLRKYKEYLKNGGNSRGSRVEIINSINPTSYTIFKLIGQTQLSKTVDLLKFAYGDCKEKMPNALKYNSGQFFLLKAKDHLGEFTRAYTPIPVDNDGELVFTILVRLYDEGRMSGFLRALQIGEQCLWRGPYGDFLINYNYKYIFFIAQGTGLAPIFSVINEIVHNDEGESFVKLFFCCRDCDDILLRDQLYEWSSYWNFNYEIFVSNNSNFSMKYNEVVHQNKLSLEHIFDYVRDKGGKLQAIICGSDTFSETIKGHVENAGIESNHIHLF